MSRQVPRWTRKQKQNLLLGIGAYGIEWLKRKSGNRSRFAVHSQVLRVCGLGGLTRGSFTLQQTVEQTGYNPEQLARAGKALQQRWARTSRRGAFLLTEDQIEQLVAWLRQDYWCSRLRLYGCLRCGTVRQPPRSFGLCRRCYYTVRRRAIGLGLPFVASKLRERVGAVRDQYKNADREFLDLLDARLEQRWAPSESDLERLAVLVKGKRP